MQTESLRTVLSAGDASSVVPRRWRYAPHTRSSSGRNSQEMISSAVQVRQGARHLQPMSIFRQAAIANFVEPEDAFDDVETVLDLRTHLRLRPIALAQG